VARSPLRFRADGTFTLVQLTDLHVRDGDAEDLRTLALVEAVLDLERPDLVVFTGDVVGGDESRDPCGALRRALAPVEERGLPWAFAFGNHDDEGPATRLELLEVLREHPGCLAERGPAELPGAGHYVVRLLPSRGDGLAAALYVLDSGGANAEGIGDYDWFRGAQVEWYRRTAAALAAERGEGRLPALAFFHIPIPEYAEAWETVPCTGFRGEPVCSAAVNSGIFAAFLEAGDVAGVFVGHDHRNDFEARLRGVRLCYGRASGYGGYGRDDFRRGARVVRLREGERDFETWIRLDDGSLAERPVHEPDAWAGGVRSGT
jgi:hypothetical protein